MFHAIKKTVIIIFLDSHKRISYRRVYNPGKKWGKTVISVENLEFFYISDDGTNYIV